MKLVHFINFLENFDYDVNCFLLHSMNSKGKEKVNLVFVFSFI